MSLGERAFLWAIFACTSRQCNALGIALDELGQDECLQIEAERLAMRDEPPRDIGSVRALLTLALLQVGYQSWSKAWLHVRQAVYFAVDLRRTSPVAAYDEDKTRTILGCFILETLIAGQLGPRPYLRRSDVSSPSLRTSGIDEWETWHPSRHAESAPLDFSHERQLTQAIYRTLPTIFLR